MFAGTSAALSFRDLGLNPKARTMQPLPSFLRGLSPVLLAAVLTACIGQIGASDDASVDDDGSVKEEEATNALPLRRLTPFEIDRSLAELLGDDSHAALSLRPENVKVAFETDPKEQAMTRQTLELYETIVYAAALRAATDPVALLGCEPATANDACVRSFIERFGQRAFRRTLTESEIERYVGVVVRLDPTHGKTEALARAVQAMLMSPNFLYLTAFGVETDDTEHDVALQPHELAARLSFFLWGQVPDEALVAAAERGDLASDEGLEKEARRLLADPRAAASAARFFSGWLDVLDIRSSPKSAPEWTAELVASAERETDEVVRAWFAEGAPVSELLSSDTTRVDAELARFYGISGEFGADFVEVSGTRERGRSGLLGQAAFLSVHATERASSPTIRGKWILDRALCSGVGPPPKTALQDAPPLEQGMSTREWHELIQKNGVCATCHDRMEPPGYLFEGFDAIGQVRTTDADKPVRTDATLATGIEDVDQSYADARGFTDSLAKSESVRACIAEHWLEYAIAKDTGSDDPDLAPVEVALAESGEEVALTIVMSRSFRNARLHVVKP